MIKKYSVWPRPSTPIALVVVILVIGLCLITLLLSGCAGSGFQNGDTIIATRNTTAWQCPGGEGGDSSSLERAESCVEQINQGMVSQGTTATIIANDDGVFLRGGYLRVEITSYIDVSIIEPETVIPSTGIRWVNASDFEK